MLKPFLLTLAACAAATVIIRHGPLEPDGWGERLGIASVWMLGFAWVALLLVRRRRRQKS